MKARPPTPPSCFSLEQAQALLSTVEHVTAEAVRQSEALGEQSLDVAEHGPEHARLSAAPEDVVAECSARIRALVAEVKGLWPLDFDPREPSCRWR